MTSSKPMLFPKTPDGTPLAFPDGRRLYGLRPEGLLPVCPYCKRESPGFGHRGDNRGDGFRKSGWRSHLFACYEKALKAAGWYEARYIARREAFLLRPIPSFDCAGCGKDVAKLREYAFMVTAAVWNAVAPNPNVKLCIGCLEKRLGRPLARPDFDWSIPLMQLTFRRSVRLRARMGVP